MCELFAMSTHTPTALTYSLEKFSRNGSSLRSNRDGWGIALARDRDAFFVKEPAPADDSVWVRFIAENPIETTVAIAHVRYATIGEHTMENTHPFRRVLGRHTHVFAHNGTLKGIEDVVDRTTLSYQPVGDTDSELAFCTLLCRLKPLYEKHDSPSVDARFEVFSKHCAQMSDLGSANFLYYDGEILFAHADARMFEEGGQHVGPRAPGLCMKSCWTCESQKKVSCPGLEVELQHPQTVLLASVPLDSEGWEELDQGTVIALKDGEVLRRALHG